MRACMTTLEGVINRCAHTSLDPGPPLIVAKIPAVPKSSMVVRLRYSAPSVPSASLRSYGCMARASTMPSVILPQFGYPSTFPQHGIIEHSDAPGALLLKKPGPPGIQIPMYGMCDCAAPRVNHCARSARSSVSGTESWYVIPGDRSADGEDPTEAGSIA